ncbi:CCA tRNA nucleotidyltransferase, mitochondrial [Polyrhizophydium stewartii]|uniref:CCA tRNA nucleotidyltransferase, mitochondrial n=1 Tax=Polyrhizophydium stewartii TaxID=2732419 RepID=A0ABR4N7L8_9FUNG|nr:CCA tRNA nucleotidyltransferase, mitochondrial [Polyrhizophydium stewartii]
MNAAQTTSEAGAGAAAASRAAAYAAPPARVAVPVQLRVPPISTAAAVSKRPAARPPSRAQPAVHLSPVEAKIRALLLDTAAFVQRQQPDRPPLVLRVAGGWVRDKLLGRDSDDMDIAIDTMKGEPFARHLKEYMETVGLEMGSIATIQVNPDKSKHLETATARVFGLDVDFVHLRTEVYDESSRNPTVNFGTPLEDALRRDITINALFYNLHSGEVEDLTGTGISDLNSGLVRTPLDPLQTFIDDPLRVLRVIRFATRFHYEIVRHVLEAAADEQIKTAFMKKITRERVGVELDKMLAGQDPVRALRLIRDIGFYPLVFTPPPELPADVPIQSERAVLGSHIIDLIHSESMLAKLGLLSLPLTPEDLRNLHLAAALLPYRTLTYKHKNKDLSVVRFVVCNSIKLSNIDGDTAHALVNDAPKIRDHALRNASKSLDRMTLGLLVRDLGGRPLGAKWDLAVLMALAEDLADLAAQEADPFAMRLDSDAATSVIAIYAKLLADIAAHGLQNAYQLKHIVDGKDLASLLSLRPGPQIGRYLQIVMEWQLTHPTGTRAQCVEYMLTRHGHTGNTK